MRALERPLGLRIAGVQDDPADAELPIEARLILPAWVADECRLGRARVAYRVLERERLRGALNRDPGVYGPRDPRSYIRVVKRLLRRTGYRC
jgi:hypothetical protein